MAFEAPPPSDYNLCLYEGNSGWIRTIFRAISDSEFYLQAAYYNPIECVHYQLVVSPCSFSRS